MSAIQQVLAGLGAGFAKLTGSVGTPVDISPSYGGDYSAVTLLEAGKVLFLQNAYSNGGRVIASIGTLSGNSISIGSETVVFTGPNSGNGMVSCAVAALNSTTAVAFYSDGDRTNRTFACVLTISGSTIAVGTEYQIDGGALDINGRMSALAVASDTLVWAGGSASAQSITTRSLTVSGTTITVGSAVTFNPVYFVTPWVLLGTNKVLLTFTDRNTNKVKVVVMSVSGTTLTENGNASTALTVNTGDNAVCCTRIQNDKALLQFASSSVAYTAIVSVTGTTPTIGTEVSTGISVVGVSRTCLMDTDRLLWVNKPSAAAGLGRVITISGSSVSVGTSFTVSSNTSDSFYTYMGVVYAPSGSGERVVLAMNSSSGAGIAIT